MVADALRLLRESKGMTQRQVADGLGCSPSVISAWERGRRAPPLEQLIRLADLLALDLGDLDDALELAGAAPGDRGGRDLGELDARRLARRVLGRDVPHGEDLERELAGVLEAIARLARRPRP